MHAKIAHTSKYVTEKRRAVKSVPLLVYIIDREYKIYHNSLCLLKHSQMYLQVSTVT